MVGQILGVLAGLTSAHMRGNKISACSLSLLSFSVYLSLSLPPFPRSRLKSLPGSYLDKQPGRVRLRESHAAEDPSLFWPQLIDDTNEPTAPVVRLGQGREVVPKMASRRTRKLVCGGEGGPRTITRRDSSTPCLFLLPIDQLGRRRKRRPIGQAVRDVVFACFGGDTS